MKRLSGVITVGILLSYSAAGFAEMTMPDHVSQFDAADANNDGQISQDEFKHHCSEVYFFNDKNMDGTLAGNEIPATWNTAQVANSDVNNDGKLDLQEFTNLSRHVFVDADVNGDNVIMKSEADTAVAREHRLMNK